MHAASFLRQRKIVLETELAARPRLMRRILLHEIFHFVWLRLGNPVRNNFADLLLAERQAGALGEVGESAQVRKDSLRTQTDRKSRPWRDYVCESFCDTAAWVCCGKPLDGHCTLRKHYRNRRVAWIQDLLAAECPC